MKLRWLEEYLFFFELFATIIAHQFAQINLFRWGLTRLV